MGGVCSA